MAAPWTGNTQTPGRTTGPHTALVVMGRRI